MIIGSTCIIRSSFLTNLHEESEALEGIDQVRARVLDPNVVLRDKITGLPSAMLHDIASYLNLSEVSDFAKVCTRTRDVQRKILEPTIKLEEEMRQGPLSEDNYHNILFRFITSSIKAQSEHWINLFDEFLPFRDLSDDTIRTNALIANLLQKSIELINEKQLVQFFKNLAFKQLSRSYLWFGYRVLEPYLELPGATQALQEFLNLKIRDYYVNNWTFHLGERTLSCRVFWMNPGYFFGYNEKTFSLWKQPDVEEGNVRIPKMVLESLWNNIQMLQNVYKENPIIITMYKENSARYPLNFTLELARLITDAHIFLVHNNNIDVKELKEAKYASNIPMFTKEMEERLCELYPSHITRTQPLQYKRWHLW